MLNDYMKSLLSFQYIILLFKERMGLDPCDHYGNRKSAHHQLIVSIDAIWNIAVHCFILQKHNRLPLFKSWARQKPQMRSTVITAMWCQLFILVNKSEIYLKKLFHNRCYISLLKCKMHFAKPRAEFIGLCENMSEKENKN